MNMVVHREIIPRNKRHAVTPLQADGAERQGIEIAALHPVLCSPVNRHGLASEIAQRASRDEVVGASLDHNAARSALFKCQAGEGQERCAVEGDERFIKHRHGNRAVCDLPGRPKVQEPVLPVEIPFAG